MNESPDMLSQIMSDQPDCCGKCGSRLDLISTTQIGVDEVFVSWCNECQREVLIVER
jgi:hypothetical protein